MGAVDQQLVLDLVARARLAEQQASDRWRSYRAVASPDLLDLELPRERSRRLKVMHARWAAYRAAEKAFVFHREALVRALVQLERQQHRERRPLLRARALLVREER